MNANDKEVIWANESAPGIREILRADAKMWHLLDEKCFDGTQMVNGKQPLDEAIGKILECYNIDSLLAVRPRGSTTQTDEPRGPGPKSANAKETTTAEPETKGSREPKTRNGRS